jgi:hypothetical protein
MNQEKTLEQVIAEARKASAERDLEMPALQDETAIRKEAMKKFEAAVRAKMSPPEVLKLPSLLEQRRQEYGIIDKAFERQCVWDRILVYQIDMHQEETYVEGGLIIKSEIAKKSTRYHAARGLIVSAGLKAMDSLRSYGMELGHIVNFINSAPWRLEVDHVAAIPFELLVMNVGDIICSEDLAANLLEGSVGAVLREGRHHYVRTGESLGEPVEPWISEDH